MKFFLRPDPAAAVRCRWAGARLLLPVLLLLKLSAPAWAAATATATGIALVIGTDLYAGQPQHTACEQTAHDVRNRLRQQGFTVEELSNASAVTLRSALDSIATQLNGAPSGTTLIYVCAAAALDGQRLFVLPADVDLRHTGQPETEGIVMQALLNALAGTGGTVYADLGILSRIGLAPARALLHDRLPSGLHLALATDGGSALGALGQALTGMAVPLDAPWEQIAGVLQPKSLGPDGSATRFLLPAPTAPVLPAPAAPTASVPPAVMPPASPAQLAPSETAPTVTPGPIAQASTSNPPPGRAAKTNLEPGPVLLHPQPHHHGDTDRPPLVVSRRTQRIQEAMARQGAFAGPIDGMMSRRTLDAIRGYQNRLGDQATGVLSQTEIVRLLNPMDATR